MTTPKPDALDAALDRLIETVRTSMAVHYLDDATEAEQLIARRNRQAARAAVLALLAASEARTEKLEAVVRAARIEVERADRFGCRELRDALAALDEPEDAGDEV